MEASMSIAEKVRLRLGPGLAGTLMTNEEFDEVDEVDDDYRYELIHGVLVVSPIPGPGEAGTNEELGALLHVYRKTHPEGSHLDYTYAEQHVRTSRGRRRADRLIWTGLGRHPKVKTDLPTIAVEFVSADRRDRLRDYVEKREEYLEAGILEYWIFDRFRKILTVHLAGGETKVVKAEEAYETPLLPGFRVVPKVLFDIAELASE
jgi:Uma2 family endonuclease